MNEQKLWTNDQSGEISCFDHTGGYCRSAHAQRPQARSHWTPLGTWRVFTEAENMEWIETFGDEAECQTCGRWADPDPPRRP